MFGLRLFVRHLGLFILIAFASQLRAQSNQMVYDNSLQNDWQNWSWATVDLNQASTVHDGAKAISVSAGPWTALYLHHDAFDTSGYTNLSFWLHGGTSGGQRLQVQGILDTSAQTVYTLPPLSSSWQQISIPLSALGVDHQASFTGFWIQDRTGAAQPTFYVDDITLLAGSSGPSPTNSTVVITVDAQRNRHQIDERIYGLAFASTAALTNLHCPLNRSGGNAESRYNWEINAHNRAADFYFESIGDSPATAGAGGDDFIGSSKAGGAQPMLTMPMVGWVAKLGSGRAKLASYSIAKYGPQTDNDKQFSPNAGNGISVTNNTPITWNDPNDANVAANSAFQQGWVQHLTNRWGAAINGGLRYYVLDNEPSIWFSTHQDVHPIGARMDEVRDKTVAYAAMIKSLDPSALIAGPEEWGWSGYLYSGYDQQYGSQHGWNNLPDRAAHGGMDYLPWLLDQFRLGEAASGQRLLDIFTVHFYPQSGEFSNDLSASMQLKRNRSTRSLWDPNYLDESWIGSVVKLIPRLKSWVVAHYPGTQIGITEYNWGAENHINGATAQADILGIFGREALDLAVRWTTPAASTPTYKAIQMYRNYDGQRSTFGETSVFAGGPNPDNVAVFAAERTSDRALTVMVINKSMSGDTPVKVELTNFFGNGVALVWQLTAMNVITRLPDVGYTANILSNTLPAQSITLFVLPRPAVAAPRLRPISVRADGQFEFWIDGEAGQSYLVQSVFDLTQVNWLTLSTNKLSSNSVQILVPATNSLTRFYRAVLAP